MISGSSCASSCREFDKLMASQRGHGVVGDDSPSAEVHKGLFASLATTFKKVKDRHRWFVDLRLISPYLH